MTGVQGSVREINAATIGMSRNPTDDGMVAKATPPLGPRGRATSTGNASPVDLNASKPMFFDQPAQAVIRC
ncbi:hypothetical protein ASD05_11565 [Variovorax sp. Root434]|nr:hypothetical protein ASD05_11565 [Variovorax sp. Root434]